MLLVVNPVIIDCRRTVAPKFSTSELAFHIVYLMKSQMPETLHTIQVFRFFPGRYFLLFRKLPKAQIPYKYLQPCCFFRNCFFAFFRFLVVVALHKGDLLIVLI
jgi:hypothetical protein